MLPLLCPKWWLGAAQWQKYDLNQNVRKESDHADYDSCEVEVGVSLTISHYFEFSFPISFLNRFSPRNWRRCPSRYWRMCPSRNCSRHLLSCSLLSSVQSRWWMWRGRRRDWKKWIICLWRKIALGYLESITEKTSAHVQHFDSISTWTHDDEDYWNNIGHLEVDNEDDDLGDRSLQTEWVGILVLQGLINQKINNMWPHIMWTP